MMTDAEGKEFALAGFERFFSRCDGMSYKIAHVMGITGSVEKIIANAPEAFCAVINANPRMRATQKRENPSNATIKPQIELKEAASLIKVMDNIDWMRHVEEECEKPFDRYVNFPYHLSILKCDEPNFLRIVLFSDHYMSDGFSGLIVLHQLLEQITSKKETHLYPLRPPIHSHIVKKSRFLRGMENMLKRLLMPFITREIQSLEPVLPVHSEVEDFNLCEENAKPNPSFALFNNGSPENLSKALTRCREERVTLHGPAIVCAVICLYVTKFQESVGNQKSMKISLDVDYNMRKFIKPKYEEDTVGFNVAMSTLEYLKESGVSVTSKFWDEARKAKKKTDSAVGSLIMRLSLQYINDDIKRPPFPKKSKNIRIRKATMGDVNISNLGKYPYSRKHEFSDSSGDKLEIKDLHLYNSSPSLGPLLIIFLTSVDAVGYSLCHRMEKATAETFFRKYVRLMEAIGEIGMNEKISDVCQKVSRF